METKKLKILQAIYCLGRGGAERLVIDITRQLATYPDVEVLLVSFDKTVEYEYSTEGINYRFCPARVQFSFLNKTKVSVENYDSIVAEFKPDIVHSHRYLAEVITRQHINKNAVYFTHCHDNMVQLKNLSLETFSSKLTLTNFFEKQKLISKYQNCNNQFIAISQDTKQYFEKVLPIRFQNNISLLNNAIDFSRFNSANNPRPLDKIRIINVGSFLPKKNQLFLLEIMKLLKDRKIDASLTFLGEGWGFDLVKEKASSYGLNDCITFTGNVTNVTDHLRAANVYVHTASYEPFGLVLLEAMAAGLPVVSLDGLGNRGLIKNNWNGFFIEEQNAALFAEKIVSLTSNQYAYREMSENAIKFAKGFDIKNYVDKLLALYRNKLQ